MAESDERTELISRATKAIVADRGASGFGRSTRATGADYSFNPDIDLKRVLEMVQKDPVVRGAITTLVDRTIEPGYSFYGNDKKSREQSAVDKMEEMRFDRLLRMLLQHLFTYNNAFVEIVKSDEGVKELHMVDPRYIEPQGDRHGEIKQYVQQVGEGTTTWKPEEIVHLKTTPLANSVWGDVDMRSLWTACALKHHIKKLYLYQYETNQFAPLLNVGGATDEQIKRFLTHLEQQRQDLRSFIPIEGSEIEAIVLGKEQDYSKVKELLTYLDFEILNVLQVPPIAVGLPDNANRSNSDAQERALNTRIRSVQRLLEDIITHDLMPRVGFKKVTLKFNIIDDKSLDTYLQMAERMKNMGIKTELIREFLVDKGWSFPEGEIFDEELLALAKQPPAGPGQEGAPGAKKSMDMMPSRQGKLPGQASKKIGSGEQSSTRKDQLVKRTEPSWQKYGIIEVEDV